MWGLCADGHTSSKGTPSPLLGALMATRYKDEVRLRKPPAAVQKVVLPPLAMVARWLGKDQVLDRYLELATHPSAQAGLGHLPEKIMRTAVYRQIRASAVEPHPAGAVVAERLAHTPIVAPSLVTAISP